MKTQFNFKPTMLLTFVLILSFVLTGCTPNFDASGYVKACLDANTHGEFAAYAKITNKSEEEIAKMYNDVIDSEVAYLKEYNLSEEKTAEFRELFVKLYDSFKYEVGEAVKNEDGSYTVPVTTYKLLVFKTFIEDGQTYLLDYCKQQGDAGKTLTEKDLYPVIADYLFDYLNKNLETPEYAEPVTANVKVSPMKENSKIYSVDTAELQKLLESMYDMESIQ